MIQLSWQAFIEMVVVAGLCFGAVAAGHYMGISSLQDGGVVALLALGAYLRQPPVSK